MTARTRFTFEIGFPTQASVGTDTIRWLRIAQSWRDIDSAANALALYAASNAKAGVEVALRLVRVGSPERSEP